MVQIYRKLVKSFSKIKGFDGYMIAKAEFEIKTESETEKTVILRQRKNYAAIMSKTVYSGIGYTLIMYLIKPSKKRSEEKHIVNEGGTYLFTLKYTKDDIKQFVCDVKDSNYIHQTDRPVVPGFLVFEDILKVCIESAGFKAGKYTILFRSPTFANEAIDVFEIDKYGFKLINSERGTIYAIYNRRG